MAECEGEHDVIEGEVSADRAHHAIEVTTERIECNDQLDAEICGSV